MQLRETNRLTEFVNGELALRYTIQNQYTKCPSTKIVMVERGYLKRRPRPDKLSPFPSTQV
jgi:hypothetical protein